MLKMKDQQTNIISPLHPEKLWSIKSAQITQQKISLDSQTAPALLWEQAQQWRD